MRTRRRSRRVDAAQLSAASAAYITDSTCVFESRVLAPRHFVLLALLPSAGGTAPIACVVALYVHRPTLRLEYDHIDQC